MSKGSPHWWTLHAISTTSADSRHDEGKHFDFLQQDTCHVGWSQNYLSEHNKLFHDEVKAMSSNLTTTEALSKRQIKSSQLLNKEIRALSGQLKSDTAMSRVEFANGLKDLGSQLMNEITVAIASTSEQANALNQASLQTIVDLLQNRQNIQLGLNPMSSSMESLLNAEKSPEPEEPPKARPNKGNGRYMESESLKDLPSLLTLSDGEIPYSAARPSRGT
jgi:hypothetical protein